MIRPEHIEELLSLPVDERRRLLRLLQESLVVESERRSELPNGDQGSPAAKWLLSKSAGMRRGEVFGLKWFDVDFKRGQLQVQKTKTKLNRTVPMNAVVREVLARQAKSSEHVFPSPRTKARLVDLKKGFNEARLIAGVPDFQFRDLRHSTATRLMDRGEELVTVAEILGHTDIRMTKRYSHAMQERKREAMEKLCAYAKSTPNGKTAGS